MKNILRLIVSFSLAAVVPMEATAQQPAASAASVPAPAASQAQSTSATGYKDVIQGVKDKIAKDSPIQPYLDLSLTAINVILGQNAKDQDAIYAFARTVNANVDKIGGTMRDGSAFASSTRERTKKLLDKSYSDGIHMNANLSNQVKTRLQRLITDTTRLLDPSSGMSDFERDNLKEDFLHELEVITDRYVQTRIFRVGIGTSLAYAPQLSYVAVPNIDLSAFQNMPFGGSGRSLFLVDFSHASSPALNLSAKVPWAQIDVSIPTQRQSATIYTDARRFPITTATSPDLLARTTIESKLKVEVDAAVSVSLVDAYRKLFRDQRPQQWDAGIGYGTTGYRVTENATTDVRVRSDPTKTFNELPASGTTATSRIFSFHADYWRAHLGLWVSDEIQVGIVGKFYRKATVDNGPVNIRGATLAVGATWYPTFPW